MKYLICLFVFIPVISWSYNIDPKKISVSGLSSGAYMAGQLQIAYSSVFSGIGIIAGGPYYCAEGSLTKALYSCSGTNLGVPDVNPLVQIAKNLSAMKQIDNISNLKNTKVFVITGTNDSVVLKSIVDKVIEFYKNVGTEMNNIKYITNLGVGHALATVDYGNECSTPRNTPFISNCHFDTAGEILKHLYGTLNNRVEALENFIFYDQNKFMQEFKNISMAEKGVAYVPANCKDGIQCGLHMVLHGCKQTTDDIQDQFFKHSGFAEWAEANNIILIFPQVIRNADIGNPEGCWDWWGYTGPNFHTQQGPQIRALKNVIQEFSTPKFSL